MNQNNQIHCCLGCGRDTRGDYCSRCIGHGGQEAGKGRRYPARPIAETPRCSRANFSRSRRNFALPASTFDRW